MAKRERGVAREKNSPQTAERHGGYEEERMCPLWAGRRPSGYAALRRRMWVMGEFGSQRCEGSARARPRGWWGGVLYRMVVDGELGRPSKRRRTRTNSSRRRKCAPVSLPDPASTRACCRSDDPGLSSVLLRLMSLPPDARPISRPFVYRARRRPFCAGSNSAVQVLRTHPTATTTVSQAWGIPPVN